jgi:LacI family transcriptional regulator
MAADHGARPVTLADIARELRITKMAVSKALRGHQDISESTRKRVLDRARELGYVPNSTSRSLRFHRSHLIGVVVPSFMYSFFSDMLEGANLGLEEAGYHAVLTVSGEEPNREVQQIEALISRQVEGLIVVSC